MKNALFISAAFASPLVWFASQAAQFALAPLTCAWHSNAILWIASAIALALVACSGLIAWQQWSQGQQQTSGDAVFMPRWLSMSAIVLSASFFLVILAQAIPTFMMRSCD
jgi:hypothetical protein